MDVYVLEKASLCFYGLSGLAHLLPAAFVYPRIARRQQEGAQFAQQYARSARAWANTAIVLAAFATLAALAVAVLYPWPPSAVQGRNFWKAAFCIGIALISFVLGYARAYAGHLHPSQVNLAQGELDTLVRRWKAYDSQLCYPIEDGWPHSGRRFARRHALYACFWAALIALGVALMVGSVQHETTGAYLEAAASWVAANVHEPYLSQHVEALRKGA